MGALAHPGDRLRNRRTSVKEIWAKQPFCDDSEAAKARKSEDPHPEESNCTITKLLVSIAPHVSAWASSEFLFPRWWPRPHGPEQTHAHSRRFVVGSSVRVLDL